MHEVTVSAERETPSIDTFSFEKIPVTFESGPYYFSTEEMFQDHSLHAFLNRLKREASVCDIGVHKNFREATGQSDLLSQWMAASHVFSLLISKNTFQHHLGLMRNAAVVINGMRYTIISINYSDGASEAWPVRPNYLLSSDKLLDQPMPGTLRYPPTGATSGCSRLG